MRENDIKTMLAVGEGVGLATQSLKYSSTHDVMQQILLSAQNARPVL